MHLLKILLFRKLSVSWHCLLKNRVSNRFYAALSSVAGTQEHPIGHFLISFKLRAISSFVRYKGRAYTFYHFPFLCLKKSSLFNFINHQYVFVCSIFLFVCHWQCVLFKQPLKVKSHIRFLLYFNDIGIFFFHLLDHMSVVFLIYHLIYLVCGFVILGQK